MNQNKQRSIPNDAMIFGLLLIISNKMDTLLERELKEFDVTTKQWFLSETVNSLFDYPPTLKEVGNMMGSSHQNVKQVALKLQEKELMTLEKDRKDARITRLTLTEKSIDFWKKTNQKGDIFRNQMFSEIDNDILSQTRTMLEKVMSNLEKIEKSSMMSEESKEE